MPARLLFPAHRGERIFQEFEALFQRLAMPFIGGDFNFPVNPDALEQEAVPAALRCLLFYGHGKRV